jgi:thiamine-phosphate pyrophosphorylase
VIPPRIIVVTDPSFGDDAIVRAVEQAGRSVPRGALCVQLRDKQRGTGSLRLFASRLRVVTRAVGASLVVNGRSAVARDVGADGVHLGGDAGTAASARAIFPRAWVSVAAHSDEDVRRAVAEGADAVLVSPVFASRPPGAASSMKEGRGVAILRSARAVAGSVPIYALGGVEPGRARACAEAGAYGVAVMRAVLASPFAGPVARALHDALARRW